MPKQKTEIAERGSSVELLIADAVKSGASIEVLERMFTLRERVKAEQAKEAFVRAMSSFQETCPTIKKNKNVMNKDGRSIRYTFASLDSVVAQIKKPLKDNELSYRWDTKSEGAAITATCYITHVLGHSESSSFTAAIDDNQYMTSPQRSASSITFAKRQALLNALGIATGDEDTDATDANKEKNAKSPKAKIVFLLRTLNEKTQTKGEVEEAVLRLSQLPLQDKNYEEICTRLQVLIEERHEAGKTIN